MCWLHGSGFPKVGHKIFKGVPGFEGYAGSLKPAWEPIICARTPRDGTFANNALTWGCGGLWVDGCRISYQSNSDKAQATPQGQCTGRVFDSMTGGERAGFERPEQKGRWPSSVIFSHLPECRCDGVRRVQGVSGGGMNLDGQGGNLVYARQQGHSKSHTIGYADPDGLETVASWDCVQGYRVMPPPDRCPVCGAEQPPGRFDPPHPVGELVQWAGYEVKCAHCGERVDVDNELVQCPVAMLAEQSGESRSGKATGEYGTYKQDNTNQIYGSGLCSATPNRPPVGDTSTAARYFKQVASSVSRFRYQAKSSPTERHSGLDAFYWRRDKSSPIGFARITRDEWEQLGKRQRAQGNIHPTVKPFGILEYIAKLIMPPESRKLLVPFSGSGSEMIGAMRVGWHAVVGIDIISDYNDIATARIAHDLL